MLKLTNPTVTGKEKKYLEEVFQHRQFAGGDGFFTRQCQTRLEQLTGCRKALLTPSCTDALEMCALLAGIEPGDEVIVPAYAFVSTVNAFVLFGAIPVLADIRPDTMTIDDTLVEKLITPRTKAIVAMHYGGYACHLEALKAIATRHDIFLIEDAAHTIGGFHQGKHLGTWGDWGCLSFHETKNIHCGEGGALLINDERWIEKAETIQYLGTDKARFLRGESPGYNWQGKGASYLLSELNAAFLLAQLEELETLTAQRLRYWNALYDALLPLAEKGEITLPPRQGEGQNAHIFHFKLPNGSEIERMMRFLKEKEIESARHYLPLNESKGGLQAGIRGVTPVADREWSRLLRIPIPTDTETVKRISVTLQHYFNA